jgi:hypothetical protein
MNVIDTRWLGRSSRDMPPSIDERKEKICSGKADRGDTTPVACSGFAVSGIVV